MQANALAVQGELDDLSVKLSSMSKHLDMTLHGLKTKFDANEDSLRASIKEQAEIFNGLKLECSAVRDAIAAECSERIAQGEFQSFRSSHWIDLSLTTFETVLRKFTFADISQKVCMFS